MAYDREAAGKLKSAVMQGDVKAARRLIKGGTDVNSVSFQKYWETSLLHEAVITGKDEMVQILLSSGAAVDCIDMSGNTALHLACRRNNIEIVNVLLKHHARTDCLNEDGYTALRIALWRSGAKVVESVVNAAAKSVHSNEPVLTNNWALNIAVSRHDLGPSVTQLLIDKGARINHPHVETCETKTVRRQGALDCHFMLTVPDVDSIRILLENGADPFQSCAMKDIKLSFQPATVTSRDGTTIATDYLHQTLGEYILRTLRSKESCKSQRKNFPKILEKCTDQDLVDDLIHIDQSEYEKSSLDSDSESQATKKSHVRNASQSETYSCHYVKTLSHKCRVVIRRHLSVVNKDRTIKLAMKKLPLPKSLINYIACKELVSFVS